MISCWLLLLVLIAPPALAGVTRSGPTQVAGLHVAGNRLLDSVGNTIALHGVNISGTEFACAQGGSPGSAGWSIFGGQPEDDPGTISAIKSWHVNVVRVPLNEDCWLGINGISDRFGGAAYRTAISHLVADLSRSGMYVIVDLHWSAPGPAVALSQQPMADEDHSITFWKSVATTFAANSSVMFDLYNEPFIYSNYFQNSGENAWSCWLHGCSLNQYLSGGHPYTRNYSWRAAGMQELIDAVRSTGASNVVIVNGLNWANDDSGWLGHQPQDPGGNLVAGWHEYGGEQCAAIDCWSRDIAPVALKVPLVVGETGDHTGGGCTLTNLPTFLPWADERGISYLAWTFNPWGYTHDVLIKDWKGTPSACEGEYYQGHLATLAANPPAPPAPATAPASAPAKIPAASHISSSLSGARPLYITILLMGVLLFLLGVGLAADLGSLLTRSALHGLRNIQVFELMRIHRSSSGFAMAACGAILILSALRLLG